MSTAIFELAWEG